MKKNKELIAEIVDRLKATEDFAYREGAWEKFSKKEYPAGIVVRKINKYLAAAAILLMGFVVAYYSFMHKQDIERDIKHSDAVAHSDSFVEKEIPKIQQEENSLQLQDNSTAESTIGMPSFNEYAVKSYSAITYIGPKELTPNLNSENLKLSTMHVERGLANVHLPAKQDLDKNKASQDLRNHLIMANAAVTNNIYSNSNNENIISPKSFNFSERFDLGLFISPYSSSDNLKVGAGLTLAYNINTKLSIRTGASYNNYEVGMLKNPLEASSVERVEAAMVNSDIKGGNYSSNLMQKSKLNLPNINAVSGFVHSVEIPLEVKYKVNKTLYAVAGVSYSTIVSQERNAQYIENASFDTFSNGFPENEKEASQALSVITKTIKSSEQNVNTAGYNGFINLSIGKKMKVNRKFGVSIEPYYKIPVGEFKKADMNYSNGGVRIMTNF